MNTKDICLVLVVAALLVACGGPEDNASDGKEESSSAILDESPAKDGDDGTSIGVTEEDEPAGDTGENRSVAIRDEDSFLGAYDSEIEISQESIESIKAMAASYGRDADKIIAELLSVKTLIVLRKDGVCIMTSESASGTATRNLTWSLNDEGTEVTLREPTDATMPELVLLVSEDGNVLTFRDTGTEMDIKMTYTRQ